MTENKKDGFRPAASGPDWVTLSNRASANGTSLEKERFRDEIERAEPGQLVAPLRSARAKMAAAELAKKRAAEEFAQAAVIQENLEQERGALSSMGNELTEAEGFLQALKEQRAAQEANAAASVVNAMQHATLKVQFFGQLAAIERAEKFTAELLPKLKAALKAKRGEVAALETKLGVQN